MVVMACDDEVIPLRERIETVADGANLEEVYGTEHHLLYVACTRAQDYLFVTSGDAPSEFLTMNRNLNPYVWITFHDDEQELFFMLENNGQGQAIS